MGASFKMTDIMNAAEGTLEAGELTVAASVDNIPAIYEFVEKRLESVDCPAKVRRQIDIAIDEIFSNIAYYAYEELKRCFWRRDFTPESRQDLVDYLVERAGEDVRNAALVDEILCGAVPAWKDSPQRLANAERMLRLHPDAGSRSVFAGVTNRLRNLSPAVRASPPSLVLAEAKKGAGEGLAIARPLFIYPVHAGGAYTPDMQAVYDRFTLAHLFES